jgi:hypothetical protein
MTMWSFRRLFRFLALPVAMTGFVLVASHAGGFVLRKDQPAKIDSHLMISPAKYPRG